MTRITHSCLRSKDDELAVSDSGLEITTEFAIAPGRAGSFSHNFAVFDGILWFDASDDDSDPDTYMSGEHGTEMWLYDGQEPRLFADLLPGSHYWCEETPEEKRRRRRGAA